MKSEAAICIGCMGEKQYTGKCRVCGYDDNVVYPVAYLEPRTLLAGRYIIGKLMLYNGEGALYLALDTQTNKKTTIKEYMPDTLCERGENRLDIVVRNGKLPLYKTYLSEFVELNRNIMNADKSLCIQTVLDVFHENNTAYVVYEYITGLSLKTYLSANGGKLSWDEARDLFSPVLKSLAVLHSNGVVHRGISPSTLLVNEEHQLKIIGFEIAASRTYGSEIDFEVFSGYSPPELYNTSSRQGEWIDVYGVSAVLYRVLTGMQPQDSVSRLKDDTLSEPVLINRDIPQNVSDAIMKGMVLNGAQRIHLVSDLMVHLSSVKPLLEDVTRDLSVHKIKDLVNDDFTLAKPTKSYNENQPRARKKESRSQSYILLILLAVMIVAFIFVIFYPMVKGDGEEDMTTSESQSQTSEMTTPAASTASTTATTPVSEEEDVATALLYRMPDFKTRMYEIIEKSENYNFLKITPEYEYNNEFSAGIIFEQSIEPNTDVESGTELVVKVSKGNGLVPLPQYKDVEVSEYKKMLSDLGIKYQTWKEFSNTVKEGVITRCSVAVGYEVNVKDGEVVNIYYSKGKKEAETEEEIEE